MAYTHHSAPLGSDEKNRAALDRIAQKCEQEAEEARRYDARHDHTDKKGVEHIFDTDGNELGTVVHAKKDQSPAALEAVREEATRVLRDLLEHSAWNSKMLLLSFPKYGFGKRPVTDELPLLVNSHKGFTQQQGEILARICSTMLGREERKVTAYSDNHGHVFLEHITVDDLADLSEQQKNTGRALVQELIGPKTRYARTNDQRGR